MWASMVNLLQWLLPGIIYIYTHAQIIMVDGSGQRRLHETQSRYYLCPSARASYVQYV
jgi:hypothetical protein